MRDNSSPEDMERETGREIVVLRWLDSMRLGSCYVEEDKMIEADIVVEEDLSGKVQRIRKEAAGHRDRCARRMCSVS